jgi:hypothetical protein
MCGKCYFAKCFCPKVKIGKHGKDHAYYALCHLPNLDGQICCGPCWFTMYVVMTIFKGKHYVDLRLKF